MIRVKLVPLFYFLIGKEVGLENNERYKLVCMMLNFE